MTLHANRSVPVLAPPPGDGSPPPPLPAAPFDPTQVLDRFSAMHLDGGPRAPSAMSMSARDPIPRAGTSMSTHSQYSHLPTGPGAGRPPRGSSMGYHPDSTGSRPESTGSAGGYAQEPPGYQPDGASSVTGQIIAEEGADDEGGLAYDTPDDGASTYSHQQQQQQAYYAQQQQQQQWQQQQAPYYNGYPQQGYPPQDGQPPYPAQMGSPYAARSPYAQSVRSFSSSQSAPSMPPGGPPSAYPPSEYSGGSAYPASEYGAPPGSYASSEYGGAPPGSYASSEYGGGPPARADPGEDDGEFAMRRPGIAREPTGVPSMRVAKVKAVDLAAPPYTKQYIDEYRARIKADPDAEAHFAYARYLVDAAKRVGADAKDQRAVKKYREALLAEALKVLRRLATQGTPYDEAQFFLANCYGTGLLGLQVDHERAYHLYLQAAKQNNAAAAYRVAVCNEIGAGTRKEPARAAAFYRKAASLGDTAAMYKLGMILLDGALGEAKNPRDAVGWLRRAAEQADEANPHALHELGLLHDRESPGAQLVPYDPVYAKRLFTQAGQLGYTHAQFRLGQMYERGAPATPQDPRRSIAWYTKAAEKGHAEAELALSGWYLTGVEGVLKQSDSEAYLWARRAANKGLSKAEYAVGYYAEIGIGIKQDLEFAKRWYMRAAGPCTALVWRARC
jgi:TPR repeat protein